jgi:hypothetical protein
MPSNSLLASEAVPSVSFQRVIFPLTVIADPLFSEFVNLFADRDRFAGWELDDGGAAEVRRWAKRCGCGNPIVSS